ncbi:MAG: hypothetical protein ABIU95_00715 [Burkholderiales bacterium]
MAEVLHEPIDGVHDLRRLVRAPVLGIIPLVALPGESAHSARLQTRGRRRFNLVILAVALCALAGALAWSWRVLPGLDGFARLFG